MTGATQRVTPAALPMAAEAAGAGAWVRLQQLLCGQAAAADHLANAVRVEAYGHTTFGRTDAVDLFAVHPLVFSSRARVLLSAHAIAVIDEAAADTPEDTRNDTAPSRTVGAFADLVDGVIARLWVVAGTAADAVTEPAVQVARDDFMSQLRQQCLGAAADHPELQAGTWPRVVELCSATLGALPAACAASSSQAWVLRAFSSGPSVVVLVRWRLQAAGLPRRAHCRLALAIGDAQDPGQEDNAHALPRLALSDPLPEPAPVSF